MKVLGAAPLGNQSEPPRSSFLSRVAGPAAIAALVLVVLHEVVFGGWMFSRNPDLLAFWLPNQCFLGDELMAGRIPYWNPFSLSGTPFAADPQSGWMYLPMMALGALPCDVALRALVVFFPLAAGLGGYAFLRGQGASRAGATVAGLALAGVTSGSALAVTVTFAGFMAWTPWMLAAAEKALSARSVSARLGWATVAALVWGQLAAAHISNGLVMGSALLAMFWIWRSVDEVRSGRMSAGGAAALAAMTAVLLIAVNLAYLLPRVMYLERSTIGLGYEGLFELRNQLWGQARSSPPMVRVTEAPWLLRLVTTPGAYLGALPLVMSFGGLFVRRWRGIAVVLWIYAAVFYVIGIGEVAEVVERLLGGTFLGDFYGHAPARFGYAPVLGLCLLAGVGVEAWRGESRGEHGGETAPSVARRVAMLVPGVIVWGAPPVGAGVEISFLWLAALGLVAAVPFVFFAAGRPALWAPVCLALAVELCVNGLYGQTRAWERAGHGLTDPKIVGMEPLRPADVDVGEFVSEMAVLDDLGEAPDERWLTLYPSLNQLGRQMVHEISEVQGYNPVQLRRYWSYTRAVAPRGVDPRPRITVFEDLPARAVLDMLNVRYVATQATGAPGPQFEQVGDMTEAEDDGDDETAGWTVWKAEAAAPPAALFASYELLPSPKQNLAAVTEASFDPQSDLTVERAGVSAETSHAPEQPAELGWIDPSTVQVRVDPSMHGYLLVRVPYDDHWTAEIDGTRAEVFPANYLLQAVEVRPGDHVVRLEYRDPWVLRGLWGSVGTLATVGMAMVALRLRRKTDSGTPPGKARPSTTTQRPT